MATSDPIPRRFLERLELDRHLLERVRDPGDEAGWSALLARYEPWLLAFVRGRGLREDDARDVVQDIFVKLYRALPRFTLDRRRGRFQNWLWQVALRAAIDWQRREGRRRRAEFEWRRRHRPWPPPLPEARLETRHCQLILGQALRQLRARTRPKTWTCFEQYLLQGRPSAVIAAELGLTPNAVCVNGARVLARLRARVGGGGAT